MKKSLLLVGICLSSIGAVKAKGPQDTIAKLKDPQEIAAEMKEAAKSNQSKKCIKRCLEHCSHQATAKERLKCQVSQIASCTIECVLDPDSSS